MKIALALAVLAVVGSPALAGEGPISQPARSGEALVCKLKPTPMRRVIKICMTKKAWGDYYFASNKVVRDYMDENTRNFAPGHM